MYDYTICNGTVVDGTRGDPYHATVCISDGKIAAITTQADIVAKQIFDVSGKIIAPGFIDMHTHSDPTRLISPLAEGKICQGVTLEIGGNCGVSVIPTPENPAERNLLLTDMSEKMSIPKSLWESDARNISDYSERINNEQNTIHLGMLVGHNALRGCVMGYARRSPTPVEMDQMRTLLEQMLEQGAFGLSLGLVYAPGIFCETEELIELARVVKNMVDF